MFKTNIQGVNKKLYDFSFDEEQIIEGDKSEFIKYIIEECTTEDKFSYDYVEIEPSAIIIHFTYNYGHHSIMVETFPNDLYEFL